MKALKFKGKPNRNARKASKMALRRHAGLTEYLKAALPVCLPKVVYTRAGDKLVASVQICACKLPDPEA